LLHRIVGVKRPQRRTQQRLVISSLSGKMPQMNRKDISEKKLTNPVTLQGISIPCEIIFEVSKYLNFMELRYFASTSKDIQDVVCQLPFSDKVVAICMPDVDSDLARENEESSSDNDSEDESSVEVVREESQYSWVEINKVLSARHLHKERIKELNKTSNKDVFCYIFSPILIFIPIFIMETILGYDERYRRLSGVMGFSLWLACSFFAIKKKNKIDSERNSERESLKKLPELLF
jgi:hypothetical protein